MYFWFKIFHLAGVVLWIGPPLGAYLMQLYILNKQDKSGPTALIVRRAFIAVLTLEHAALALLMAGALAMLWYGEWVFLTFFWIQMKILIFCLVIIPIEILDIWWGQISPVLALRRDKTQDSFSPELVRIFRRYDRFVYFSIPFLLISWTIFFYLAAAKPT